MPMILTHATFAIQGREEKPTFTRKNRTTNGNMSSLPPKTKLNFKCILS